MKVMVCRLLVVNMLCSDEETSGYEPETRRSPEFNHLKPTIAGVECE